MGFVYFCTAWGRGHRGGKGIKQDLWRDWERRVQRNTFKVDLQLQEICANLQGNVSASVPDALQKAGLAVVEVQQLRPHAVVDVEEVVGVCAGVLHHLLWQGATGPGESSGVFQR